MIDFYILSSNSTDAFFHFVCRLTEKAIKAKNQVFINSSNIKDANTLDAMLWTFSQGSFIPHLVMTKECAASNREPVIIGIEENNTETEKSDQAENHFDLMINLASDVPAFFSRYTRVMEVVDSDPLRKEKGRLRYRFYKDRGYRLKHHNI